MGEGDVGERVATLGRCFAGELTMHHYLCLLFIHPRAPNLISLRSAGTMPT